MHWSETPGDAAAAYAQQLLDALGVDIVVPAQPVANAVAADWATSGAMALTGPAGGAPQLVTGAPATALRGAVIALETLARTTGNVVALPTETMLGERAAIAGLTRQGATSPGGSTRLLRSCDGLVAVSLKRASDHELLPALFAGQAVPADPWAALARWCADRAATDIVERGTHLGLAVARLGETSDARPFLTPALSPRRPRAAGRLLVIDLSALWAGPLCSLLLGWLGARVIAVESTRRPDPIRASLPRFHDLLRSGSESVALDLTDRYDAGLLRELLTAADIVVEGSRPRALAQLGIDAAEIVAAPGDRTWISITGHGRGVEAGQRVGYGDDTAVAAGLLGTGQAIAGDAIGDPLTGVHAAVAAYAGAVTGRSHIVDVAMSRVVRACVTTTPPVGAVHHRGGRWWLDTGADVVAVAPAVARTPTGAAPGFGSSTSTVLSELLAVSA